MHQRNNHGKTSTKKHLIRFLFGADFFCLILLIWLGISRSSVAQITDPNDLLSPNIRQYVESLSQEHEVLTGQKLQLEVESQKSDSFPENDTQNSNTEPVEDSPQDSKEDEQSERVLYTHDSDSLTSDNGVVEEEGDQLVVIEIRPGHQSRIQSSFRIDALFPSEKRVEIIETCLSPTQTKEFLSHSVICAFSKSLEALQSPLLSSGRAAELNQQFQIPEPEQWFTQSGGFGMAIILTICAIGFLFFLGVLQWRTNGILYQKVSRLVHQAKDKKAEREHFEAGDAPSEPLSPDSHSGEKPE